MIPVLIFAIILVVLIGLFQRKRRKQLLASGIYAADKLTGHEFEHFLKDVFIKLGFRVTLTAQSGDYGADLIIEKDNIRTVVQAKRYKKLVGIQAIQEVVSAKQHYKCSHALVVTNSNFTKAARNLAYSNHVTLWYRKRLITVLLALNESKNPGTIFHSNSLRPV
jgi:restriction system protein